MSAPVKSVRIVMKRGTEKRTTVARWNAKAPLPKKGDEVKVKGGGLPYYVESAKEVPEPLSVDFSGRKEQGGTNA